PGQELIFEADGVVVALVAVGDDQGLADVGIALDEIGDRLRLLTIGGGYTESHVGVGVAADHVVAGDGRAHRDEARIRYLVDEQLGFFVAGTEPRHRNDVLLLADVDDGLGGGLPFGVLGTEVADEQAGVGG